MLDKNSADTKERIMAHAEELFAEKGFEGARVDEIARRAGVNKALIYYYFKSKEDVLEKLLEHLLEEGVGLLSPGENILETFGTKRLDDLLYAFLDFLESHRNMVKVLLMESLKEGPRSGIIFKYLRMATEAQQELSARFGFEIHDLKETMVVEFFTGLVPIMQFVVFQPKWEEFFGTSPEELRAQFIDAFKRTHVRYTEDEYLGKREESR